jgi:glutamate formiminotransferase/glutamate formiminotransferase/formiminotetrahydrofolate cyclodeaminase
VLAAVPNVSEGRDASAIARIGDAFAASARLVGSHSDEDHHRSVFVLVGERSGLVDSLVAGIAAARDLIDLRSHEGVHPRVGAADVVPLVPIVPGDLAEACGAALEVAERTGTELGIPVLLYGEVGGGRRPAYFRRGGLEELARRIDTDELSPDFGPLEVDPRTGVVLVGARRPLVAYNVELETKDLAVAKAVAAAVRESSGGLPGVQAIGLELPRTGRIQVSMNIIDIDATPLHEAVAAVAREARARGVEPGAGELVGLVPAAVLTAAEEAGVEVDGVDETCVLERLAGL